MFIARFALGLGIGPKSATVPIYAAECTPPQIRGALVMQWQVRITGALFFLFGNVSRGTPLGSS
jgi:MFS family permease